jgi:hypothetical protein
MIRSLSKCAATNLDTRLASQAALEVHQATADLVTHGGFAVLCTGDRVLATAGGGCAASASATNASAVGS